MIHVSVLGLNCGRVVVGFDRRGDSVGEWEEFSLALPVAAHGIQPLVSQEYYSSENVKLFQLLLGHQPFTFEGRMYTFRHVKPNQEEHNAK